MLFRSHDAQYHIISFTHGLGTNTRKVMNAFVNIVVHNSFILRHTFQEPLMLLATNCIENYQVYVVSQLRILEICVNLLNIGSHFYFTRQWRAN